MTAVTNAIPTRYAGCHFRSRLEARWAVFFDTMGIAWDYEPQGFEVGWPHGPFRRNYLPDFYLPFIGRSGLWVEVKASEARLDRELLLAAAMPDGGLPADPSGTRVDDFFDTGDRLLILGPIPNPRSLGRAHSLLTVHGGEVWVDRVALSFRRLHPERWACVYQFSDGISLREPSPSLLNSPYPFPGRNPDIESSWPGMRDKLLAECGYGAARSARFEHGQSGPT